MNDRTCIVTRKSAAPDELIRFVVGPDFVVVPDLKRKLPGRGCWVTAHRSCVEKAASRNLFLRAFKCKVTVPEDLAGLVDTLMAKSALGSLGLARKAGQIALGAAKVDAAVRRGDAIAVVHAAEAAGDGERKIRQAAKAVEHMGGPTIRPYKLFSQAELSLALGGTNVIHAAVLAGEAGNAACRRMVALDRYRGGSPDLVQVDAAVADKASAAEETE